MIGADIFENQVLDLVSAISDRGQVVNGAYLNSFTGAILISRNGSDCNETYLCVNRSNRFLTLWNGKRHKLDNFKVKNIRHCFMLSKATPESLALLELSRTADTVEKQRQADAMVRKFLRRRI